MLHSAVIVINTVAHYGAGTAQNSGAVRWIQVVRLMAYFIGTVLVCAAAAFIIIGLGAAAVVNIR